MTRKTKGQIEALISQAAVKFEREYMGRGPSDARTHLIQDMVIVRLKGILTPAEQQLVKAEGVELIKQVRTPSPYDFDGHLTAGRLMLPLGGGHEPSEANAVGARDEEQPARARAILVAAEDGRRPALAAG